MAVTCDDASDNRRLFSLHGINGNLTYKTLNVYSKVNNAVYFISDPSHFNSKLFSKRKVAFFS